MRFWDSSAIVPLILEENRSAAVEAVFSAESRQVLWWGTAVEATSALVRWSRSNAVAPAAFHQALGLLQAVREGALEISPSEEVRVRAMRLLAAHSLRAADALQLAAALLWRGNPARKAEFVCLDDRLRVAAQREGFEVLPGTEDLTGA